MKRKAIVEALEALPVKHVLMAVEVVADHLWEQQRMLPGRKFLRAVQLGCELNAKALAVAAAPEPEVRAPESGQPAGAPSFEESLTDLQEIIDQYNRKPAFPISALEAARKARAAGRIARGEQLVAEALAALPPIVEAERFVDTAQGVDVYASPSIPDDEANVLALALLRPFDGIPLPVVRQVLSRAEFWLCAVSCLDCGEATEFARAVEGWKRAAEQSL